MIEVLINLRHRNDVLFHLCSIFNSYYQLLFQLVRANAVDNENGKFDSLSSNSPLEFQTIFEKGELQLPLHEWNMAIFICVDSRSHVCLIFGIIL